MGTLAAECHAPFIAKRLIPEGFRPKWFDRRRNWRKEWRCRQTEHL
jgi:hypothetical protein